MMAFDDIVEKAMQEQAKRERASAGPSQESLKLLVKFYMVPPEFPSTLAGFMTVFSSHRAFSIGRVHDILYMTGAMLLDRLVVLYVLVAIAALVGVGFFMCVGCLLDENMLVYVLSVAAGLAFGG